MRNHLLQKVLLSVWAMAGWGWLITNPAWAVPEAYPSNPFVIPLEIPGLKDSEDSAGGLVAADLNGDGRMDYLVTVPGHVAAYAHDGPKLWVLRTDVIVGGSSESQGLPGHHGPGVQAADIDGDGRAQVLFLTRDGVLHVVHGAAGQEEWTAKPPVPEGAERWEHLVIANFRGDGDCDLLLQATNAQGYRMGRYLAAYRLDDLKKGGMKPLWARDDFIACAHNGARVADLDGDGRDEVLSGMILGPDGKELCRLPVEGHIDSIFVADVCPERPGLEAVALEEGGNRVFLFGRDGIIWTADYNRWEPQNAAVGDFDPERPGLEVWCRSRFNTHQKPFVFDAKGRLITQYEMDAVAPKDWTEKGVEVIWTIDWQGGAKRFAAAKERHTSGHVAVFDPLSGRFAARIEEKADRLYVADVAGDAREELVVVSGNELRVHANPEPVSGKASPWSSQAYRRSKMTWNYYSP